MKKALKIVAVVLIVAIIGVAIYVASSSKTPVDGTSYKAVFRSAYAVEKNKFEYGEDITIYMMISTYSLEQRIDGGDLHVIIEDSPYYEIVSENTEYTIENITDSQYVGASSKNEPFPILLKFTIRINGKDDMDPGVNEVIFKAKFNYIETRRGADIPNDYKGEEYFYGFNSLMFVADDFGIWFSENREEHNSAPQQKYWREGYIFVKDDLDDWKVLGVESLDRYANEGYTQEALLDKIIEYNSGGKPYLTYDIEGGNQYCMYYFSPTLRAKIQLNEDDELLTQFHNKDFDTYEEKANNRTDLMKKVIALLYEKGAITEEQYNVELALIEANPGFNYVKVQYKNFVNFNVPHGDDYYDVVVDVR